MKFSLKQKICHNIRLRLQISRQSLKSNQTAYKQFTQRNVIIYFFISNIDDIENTIRNTDKNKPIINK